MASIIDNITHNDFTPQQCGLILSVVKKDAFFLNRHRKTVNNGEETRFCPLPSESEIKEFLDLFENNPQSTIFNLNKSIMWIHDLNRRDRYIGSAIDLEVLVDHIIFPSTSDQIHQGIPPYLMDGYTDMGHIPHNYYRDGRAKFRFSKTNLLVRSALWTAKEYAISDTSGFLFPDADLMKLAVLLSVWVHKNVKYDGRFVERKERGEAQTMLAGDYVDNNYNNGELKGVCRQQAVWFQTMSQTAGLKTRLCKGDFGNGRHGWNNLQLPNQGDFLVDVTNPHSNGDPCIERINKPGLNRVYRITPDEMNYYKIKWE